MAWIFRGISLGSIVLGLLLSDVRCAGPGRAVSWAVVWDVSASMAEPDGTGTRWSTARSAWKKVRASTNPHYLLGRDLVSVDEERLDGVRPDKSGCSGNILAHAFGDNPPDAVLVFTDGKWSEDVGAMGLPLFAVGVGEEDPAPDAAVESVQSPAVVFSGVETTVSAKVIAQGRVKIASVKLIIGGRQVMEQNVDLSNGNASVSFQWTPAREGASAGEVRVEPVEGETRLRNNKRRFVVDVRRDRVRTLYISGRPGAHYNFLRAQLKNDPAVELVSFVVLRDPEDALGYSDRDLSLIAFPSAQTLAAQLPTFSVVILEEWTALQFALGPAFMAELDQWVRRGGGALFIEDPASFLMLSPWAGDTPALGPKRFAFVPKESGHPLLTLGDAGDKMWEKMGVLEGSGVFPEKVKPGARVLATEPGGRPVLAEFPLGRGRSLGLANRSSWRWALEGGRRGEGPADYQRFWENVIRWLSASPGAGTVRVDRPTGVLATGETALLTVHGPAQGMPVLRLTARALDGEQMALPLKPGDRPGRSIASFTPAAPGPYEIIVRMGKSIVDHFWVDVSAGWDEQLDPRPDFARMAERSRLSGGEFVTAANFNSRVWSRWNRRMRKSDSNRSLSSLFLVPGLMALVLEWVWRRRRGLP